MSRGSNEKLLTEASLSDEESLLSTQRQSALPFKRIWLLATAFVVAIALLVLDWQMLLLLQRRHNSIDVTGNADSIRFCHQPTKRKEWRKLSAGEKADYLRAVRCLSTIDPKTDGGGSLHDDFAYVHFVNGDDVHGSAAFLPWHRYYLQVYEKALQLDCHYSGSLPYWDWTQDWEDPLKSVIWDPNDGFGGSGDSSTPESVGYGHCVKDGPFADLQVHRFGAEVKPHCLSRGFIKKEFRHVFGSDIVNPAAVKELMSTKDFFAFSSKLEEGLHLMIPRLVQGDFRKHTSPNDPIFFLHHAQLDRLWWQWQLSGNSDINRYSGPARINSSSEATLTDRIDLGKLATEVPVQFVMNIENGFLCYTYEDPLGEK